MNDYSFISYYTLPVDKTQEILFNESLKSINIKLENMHSYSCDTELLHTTNMEQYRVIRRFVKYWSKLNKRNYVDNIDPMLQDYKNDYSLDIKLNKLKLFKVDKQKFKQQIVSGLSPYVDMNSRIILYSDIVSTVNNIYSILLEDSTDMVGTTLSKLISRIQKSNYKVDTTGKLLCEYNKFTDIAPAFNYSSDKTLGELDYSPKDTQNFAMSMNKLKNSIATASTFLQNKLKSQPDEGSSMSDDTTLIGLLYRSLPSSDNEDTINVVRTKLYRVALLSSIFQAICGYSFDKDYRSVLYLLDTTISLQK